MSKVVLWGTLNPVAFVAGFFIMKDIVLKVSFGDVTKEVVIAPVQAARLSYHVYLDKKYLGAIHKMLDGWHFDEQKPGIFTYEDMQFMIEAARKHAEGLDAS
ncbi:MAG TPA: hypothetical protein VD907_06710 [Verrucomicrobiae bacterium]|nr:hypothetical protein [Verrucomicrobiae bacterium]